jgi:phosphoadenosine phosphosulfate reductase
VVLVAADAGRGLLEFRSLFDWAREVVSSFADARAVPRNPLHAKGFASIGCARCTPPGRAGTRRALGKRRPEGVRPAFRRWRRAEQASAG